MDVATALSVISTLAVFGGIAFSVVQIRDARRKQAAQAAQAFVSSLQTEQWAKDHLLVHRIAKGLAPEAWDKLEPPVQEAGFRVAAMCETTGILVHERVLSLNLVAEMLPIDDYWERLRPLALHLRALNESPRRLEWFQWLAERVAEHHDANHAPAYVEHKDWKP